MTIITDAVKVFVKKEVRITGSLKVVQLISNNTKIMIKYKCALMMIEYGKC